MGRILPFLLGLAAAGAAGAVVAVLVVGGPAPETGDDTRMADLQEQVDRLEREVRGLRERERTQGSAPAPLVGPGAVRAIDAPAPEEADRVADAETATGPESAAAEEKLVDRVKEEVAKEQRRRQEAIGQRFMALAAEREKSMLDRLTEKTGLTPYQRTELEKLMGRRREAIGNMFRSFFSSGEREEGAPPDMTAIREKMTEVQQKTDEEIRTLLSPDQYEAFKQEEEGNRMGMGGPPFFGGTRRTDDR